MQNYETSWRKGYSSIFIYGFWLTVIPSICDHFVADFAGFFKVQGDFMVTFVQARRKEPVAHKKGHHVLLQRTPRSV